MALNMYLGKCKYQNCLSVVCGIFNLLWLVAGIQQIQFTYHFLRWFPLLFLENVLVTGFFSVKQLLVNIKLANLKKQYKETILTSSN